MNLLAASIILPTCNRNEELVAALRSIRDQTFRNFEVIIVNDGDAPVEPHLEASTPFLADIPHTVVRTAGRSGPSAARNAGLAAARGGVLFYLDDDDIYYPDHLLTHMEAHALQDAPGAVYTDANRGLVVHDGAHGERLEVSTPYSENFDAERLLVHNFIPILCLSHSRECLGVSGRFDTSLHYMEDWEFLIRLSLSAPFRHVARVTAMYHERGRGDSLQDVHGGSYLENLFDIYHRADTHFADDLPRLDRIWDKRLKHVAVMAQATGRHYEAEGNLELARNAYENAVKCDEAPEYLVSLARVLKKLGRLPEAAQALSRVRPS